MANKKFSQFTAGGTNQVPTDVIVGLDLSLSTANQNTQWTLNNLFSTITRNITDGALRFGGFAAPSLSGAGTGALYFDSSANVFKVSSNGGAFVTLGDISGTFGATGQVAVANGTKSVTGSNGLTYAAGALTVGESGTPGGVRLVANSGNYWNIASSTPAGNRTFYFPDSITPTTGNFLFVGTFGATVVTDWSTGLTWSNTTKQLTVTAALNDVVGLGVQNTSAGTAAQCQVGFTANGGAISLLSLTGTGFTTSGLYKANQLYWRGTTGITEMLFALDDASTAFKFGVNNAVAASINATSTEGLVLGIASSLTGRIKLYNSAGATYTQISAGNAAANLNYILPATSPTAGQVLTAAAPSGGDVVLSWGAGGGGGAPVDATYLTLSLNGTLTNERVFTLADTTLSEVDGGAGGNYTLGVNQANAFAWTAAHTWQQGTSQANALSILKASIGSTGQRDSDRLLFQAKANNGTDYAIEARQYINVVSNDGVGSLFTIDGRNTFAGAGFNTLFTLSISSGDIATPGTLTSGTASAATGALNLYNSGSANVTTLQAGAAASALTYVWPATNPTSGQVLSASAPSGSTVTLSWATASGAPGGSATQLQFNNSGSFGGMTGTAVSGATLTLGNTSDGRYLLTQPGSVNSIGNWGTAQRVTVTNAGDATHPNEIYQYGFNYLGQGVAVDNRAPAWAWTLESHWAPNVGQPNNWQMEHYIDYIAPTDLSVFPGSDAVPTFRPFGLTIQPVAGNATWDWRGTTFDWITAFTGSATKLHADASNLQFTATSPVFQLIDQATSNTLDIRYNGSNQFSAIFPSWYFLSSSTSLPALLIENAHTNLNPTIESRVYGTAAPQTNTGSVGLHLTNRSGSANVYSSIGFSGFNGVPAVYLAAQTITEAPYYSEAVLRVNTRSGQSYEALRTSFENTGSISVVTFAGQGNNNPRLDLLNPGFGSTGGMYLDGANTALQFHLNSNRVMQVRYTGVTIFGPADAASPTAQTLSVQSVVAGTTNTAGQLWTFKDSAGTGNAASGGYLWQTAPAGSSGSSQNTYSTALALTSAQNLGLGTSTFGTSASKVFAIGSGTVPSSYPADAVQLCSQDYASGDARLRVYSENGAQPVVIGGNAILSGRQVVAKTADYTIQYADSNTVFTNTGASGAVIFTLCPTGVIESYTLQFFRVANQSFTIQCPPGVIIRVGASATSAGGTVTLDAVGSGLWIIQVDSSVWYGYTVGAATFA